jgi:hypothetical protein
MEGLLLLLLLCMRWSSGCNRRLRPSWSCRQDATALRTTSSVWTQPTTAAHCNSINNSRAQVSTFAACGHTGRCACFSSAGPPACQLCQCCCQVITRVLFSLPCFMLAITATCVCHITAVVLHSQLYDGIKLLLQRSSLSLGTCCITLRAQHLPAAACICAGHCLCGGCGALLAGT